jgi:phosphopantothenoylcysteine decarboxylase / phosphopantothenate---cysteine ligase
VLVTAGPTFERIDPVRFIGNHSSGKMGYALAEELANQGAKVILISGPVSISTKNTNIQRINVESAAQMLAQCESWFPQCNAAIMCAAVADYTPISVENQKVKRKKENYTIELQPTTDIAARLGQLKNSNQWLVGFALETNDEVQNAHGKLMRKNLDFIVLNSLNDAGAGFRTDTNKITIIDKHTKTTNFELKSKTEVAKDIVDYMTTLMNL